MAGRDFDSLAQQLFGFTLSPGQRQALAAVTTKRDTLAVLPTGSGKSAIYQLAGLELGGLTVVVSPLIALQRDQLRSLAANQASIAVGLLNSSQHVGERRQTLSALAAGTLDFLLLGPEQLGNDETHAELIKSGRPITLFAIDEAHLVSDWGHDFRPAYLRLPEVIRAVGRPTLLALTATAAPPVQADITRLLGMRRPVTVVADFDRPNIALAVRRARHDLAEDQALVDRTVEVVLANDTPALVYAMSHARCEELAERLQRVALRASAYHAGMPAKDRARVQDDYFGGRLDVVAATSAFGMGIDKPDVRTVIHCGVPASLDEYYQEIGRAGRDRAPAQAVLVYDERSLRIPRLFAARSRLPPESVGAVVAALRAGPATLPDLIATSGVGRQAGERIVEDLVQLGLLSVDGAGVFRSPELPADAADQVEQAARRREAVLDSRIDSVRHYADTVQCRRAELLAYFGETLAPPCDNCDNDTAPARQHPRPGSPAASAADAPVVLHRLWGRGVLLSQDEHELVVAFDSVGYRHLTPSALTNGLLTRM